MRKIDTTNYEEFAIEYLEGTLNPETRSAFEEFLEGNPKIKAEIIDLGEPVTIPILDLEHPDKEKLYKKKQRIIPIAWSLNGWGVGVAAIISLAAFAYTWMYMNREDPNAYVTKSQEIEPSEGLTKDKKENTLYAQNEITQSKREAGNTMRSSTEDEYSVDQVEHHGGNRLAAIEKGDRRNAPFSQTTETVVPLNVPEPDAMLAHEEQTEVMTGSIESKERDLPVIKTESKIEQIQWASVDPLELPSDALIVAVVELPRIDVEKKKKGINLPFLGKVKIEAKLNTFPRSFGKANKEKVKEALIPTIFASAD
jgi:hypothetical protein